MSERIRVEELRELEMREVGRRIIDAENRANGFQAGLANAYRLAKQASEALARYRQPGGPRGGFEMAEAAMALRQILDDLIVQNAVRRQKATVAAIAVWDHRRLKALAAIKAPEPSEEATAEPEGPYSAVPHNQSGLRSAPAMDYSHLPETYRSRIHHKLASNCGRTRHWKGAGNA